MKLSKKTEKALLVGAVLSFILLAGIGAALFLSPGEKEPSPAPSPTPTATPTPLISPTPTADGGSILIAGKYTSPHTDTFFLHKSTLSDSDKASISALTNLTTLSLTQCQLTDISFLAPLSNLTTLYLSDNQIADVSPLASLGKLRTLYLDNNPLSELKPLYALNSLQTLSLQNLPLPLSTLESLQTALPQCKIFDDDAAAAQRPLSLGGVSFSPDDTELYLSTRGISDISILSRCTNLRSLDLSGNPLAGVGVLKQLNTLQTLNLASTDLIDSELRVVMGLRSLRWLNITDNANLSGEVIDELFVALPACEVIHDEPIYRIKLGNETLRSDIESLTMPSAHLGSIGPLRKCSKLKNVDLSHNFISDLSPLVLNAQMSSLLLEDNRILSCEGLNAMEQLETLDISDNSLMDIRALAYCRNLQWLDVSNNLLSSVDALSSCYSLRYLDLRGNPLSWEAVETLRFALSQCEILSDVQEPLPDASIEDVVIPEDPIPLP